MDRKWKISGKGRNCPKYGYYMLLIIAAPDVRDHLSDREVSTVLFLPTRIGSMVGELPRALDISEQWISITIHEYSKSSALLNSAKRFSSAIYHSFSRGEIFTVSKCYLESEDESEWLDLPFFIGFNLTRGLPIR
jgi:hypothetical protein